jgi:DNA-binding ferritin-like protein
MDHSTPTPKQLAELERHADAIADRIYSLDYDPTPADAIYLTMYRRLTRTSYTALAAEIARLRAVVSDVLARLRDCTEREQRERQAAYNRGYQAGYHAAARKAARAA